MDNLVVKFAKDFVIGCGLAAVSLAGIAAIGKVKEIPADIRNANERRKMSRMSYYV